MEDIDREPSRCSITEEEMTVYLIEDRRARVSPWGRGNSKIGPGVYTYSKPAGRDGGSCPGSTAYCEELCYAKRMGENPVLPVLYEGNAARGDALPPLPDGAELVRGHVSGDFDTAAYIQSWIKLARENPETLFWFYTRSWRVKVLLPFLERLRSLPNVQLFASMDPECGPPPEGWRIAWLDSDERMDRMALGAIECPEETGRLKSCVQCGYCFGATRGDVVFLERRLASG